MICPFCVHADSNANLVMHMATQHSGTITWINPPTNSFRCACGYTGTLSMMAGHLQWAHDHDPMGVDLHFLEARLAPETP